jgi:kelch-like protein 10
MFKSGKIYICGGFNGQECLNSAEYYDPQTSQWSVLAPMRNRRSGVGIVAHAGKVSSLWAVVGASWPMQAR